MQKLRTAIISTGKASHMHATALKKSETIELVGVSSRRLESAREFASTYDIKAFTDIKEMVKSLNVDFVIICTPHPFHKDVTVEAMEAGAHALVEKPLAASLADCDEMIEAANRNKKKLGVVSQRRFFPATERCKKAIGQGKIGKPMLGTIYMLGWRDEKYYSSDPWRGKWATEGGGVLVNQAPHQLDLLSWFMDDEPKDLFGTWSNINHPYIEVEDTAVAIVQYKNGGIGNIVVSNSQKPGIYAKVHVHGSNGSSVGVQTETGAMFIAGMTPMTGPALNDMWNIHGEESLLENFIKEDTQFFSGLEPMQYSIMKQHDNFADAIIHNHEPSASAKDGRRTVELFTAIYTSQRKGSVVNWPL
jgi:UDP-N-acetyl-2-amino-2-deoxyglucuronate dehydrogenase